MLARKFLTTLATNKPSIALSGTTAADSATVGTAVGTASIHGHATGTASWSLADNAGGKYAIDSSTGAVTVAASLTAGTDSITIAVSGLTPAVANKIFGITVTSASSTAGQAIGLLLSLTKAA